jgi:hypothetical protein
LLTIFVISFVNSWKLKHPISAIEKLVHQCQERSIFSVQTKILINIITWNEGNMLIIFLKLLCQSILMLHFSNFWLARFCSRIKFAISQMITVVSIPIMNTLEIIWDHLHVMSVKNRHNSGKVWKVANRYISWVILIYKPCDKVRIFSMINSVLEHWTKLKLV